MPITWAEHFHLPKPHRIEHTVAPEEAQNIRQQGDTTRVMPDGGCGVAGRRLLLLSHPLVLFPPLVTFPINKNELIRTRRRVGGGGQQGCPPTCSGFYPCAPGPAWPCGAGGLPTPAQLTPRQGGSLGPPLNPGLNSPLRWVSGSPCHVPPFVGRGLMPLSHAPSTKAGSEFQVKPLHLRPPSSQQLAMAWGGRGLSSLPSAPMLSEHRLVLGCEHS